VTILTGYFEVRFERVEPRGGADAAAAGYGQLGDVVASAFKRRAR
jgi:hypothetical protein